MFLLRVSLVCAATILIFLPAEASKKRQECNAVQALARVDFDSSLSLTSVEDKKRQLCWFDVVGSSPTNNSDPIQKAADYVRTLSRGGATTSEIQTPLLDALMEPLFKSKDVDPEEAGKMLVGLKARTAQISACVDDMSTPFKKVDEFLSCGVNDDKSAFIVTASTGNLIISLSLSLA